MGRCRRREAMLEAAIALFSEKGYHATTVREIAQAVGILPGSLYAHMAAKEDLLYEAVVQAWERFRKAVAPIAASPGHAGERLRRAMAAHIRVVAESPAAATVFLHEWRALSSERRAQAVATAGVRGASGPDHPRRRRVRRVPPGGRAVHPAAGA